MFILWNVMIEIIVEYKTNINNLITDLTEVKPSHIDGLGLFAKVFIPKNTIWWSATPGDVLLINRDQYETFNNSVHSPLIKTLNHTILVYSYYVERYDALVLCLDNSRFVNHSYTPNSGSTPDSHPLASMTLRDIPPGEEILEDYTTYDKCPWVTFHEGFLL